MTTLTMVLVASLFNSWPAGQEYAFKQLNERERILCQEDDSYTVLKIKRSKNLNLIYLKRNDSIFKVVSVRQKVQGCNAIRVNQSYKLNLIPNPVRNNNLLISQLTYNGTRVSREPESYYMIYTASNLKGLCFLGEIYK